MANINSFRDYPGQSSQWKKGEAEHGSEAHLRDQEKRRQEENRKEMNRQMHQEDLANAGQQMVEKVLANPELDGDQGKKEVLRQIVDGLSRDALSRLPQLKISADVELDRIKETYDYAEKSLQENKVLSDQDKKMVLDEVKKSIQLGFTKHYVDFIVKEKEVYEPKKRVEYCWKEFLKEHDVKAEDMSVDFRIFFYKYFLEKFEKQKGDLYSVLNKLSDPGIQKGTSRYYEEFARIMSNVILKYDINSSTIMNAARKLHPDFFDKKKPVSEKTAIEIKSTSTSPQEEAKKNKIGFFGKFFGRTK